MTRENQSRPLQIVDDDDSENLPTYESLIKAPIQSQPLRTQENIDPNLTTYVLLMSTSSDQSNEYDTHIPSYMIWSIFNTLCCHVFCCFGLIALVYSFDTRKELARGTAEGFKQAKRYSRSAKFWNKLGTASGSLFIMFVIIMIYVSHEKML